jgi:thiamine kinase-like enzyme
MHLGELVDRGRRAASGGDHAALGLEPLAGGMSHHVFAPLDEPALVVKVFGPTAREKADREWEALVGLHGEGIAPEPVHLDPGDEPVVVMTRVAGTSRTATELAEQHAEILGRVHRRVHQLTTKVRRPPSYTWVRGACASLRATLPSTHTPEPAWREARSWLQRLDQDGVDRILTVGRPCFSRGDPNLTNYLWSDDDDGLVLIDWEDSGESDPVLELADFAEHASSRALTDDFWDHLAEATGLDDTDIGRVPDARRLMACFWLVLIVDRQRAGLPTTVTVDEQAERTLAVLHR